MRSKSGMHRKKLRGPDGSEALPGRKLRIVIIDGSPVCRRGLRDLLTEVGHDIVAEIELTEATSKVLGELQPDVAILDSPVSADGNAELSTLLKAADGQTQIVMMASEPEERRFNQAMSLGVKGYLLRSSPEHEILECVMAAASCEPYVSPALTNFLLRRHGGTEKLSREQPGLGRLTLGERRILRAVAQGKNSRQIAGECGISPRTVDSHRANICEKLQLKGRNCLLQFALEHRHALSHLG